MKRISREVAIIPALVVLCVVVASTGTLWTWTSQNTTSFRLERKRSHKRDEYVVLASNNYGRYSNMRRAFISAGSLAVYTNRSLLYTLPMNCEPLVAWEELIDTSALPFSAVPANPRSLRACFEPPGQPMLINHKYQSCSSRYWMPEARAGRYFNSLIEWSSIMPPVPGEAWSLNSAAKEIAGHRCGGIQCPWAMFAADAATQRLHDAVERSLLPSRLIKGEVDRFLAHNSLIAPGGGIKPFVGIHLRLTDIGGSHNASCRLNITDVMHHVEKLQATTESVFVALATDDITSQCARLLTDRFKALHVASSMWTSASCQEAVFVQEVLGQSIGFVGHSGSTFSVAIETIRLQRHSARHSGFFLSNIA